MVETEQLGNAALFHTFRAAIASKMDQPWGLDQTNPQGFFSKMRKYTTILYVGHAVLILVCNTGN